MDYKESIKFNCKSRTERSEVHSRPKGVNDSDKSRILNHELQRIQRQTSSFAKVMQGYLEDQWLNNFQPQWFVTLEWKGLPSSFETVAFHSKTFKNIFLTQLLGCKSPTRIPEPQLRPSLIFMQERKRVIRQGREILAYHTHFHLGRLPDSQNQFWYLDHLINQKVSPRIQRLLKTTTEGNRGVVIKPWVWDHHAFYNLKDYHIYKHHQDPDLVLDYGNSDLLSK